MYLVLLLLLLLEKPLKQNIKACKIWKGFVSVDKQIGCYNKKLHHNVKPVSGLDRFLQWYFTLSNFIGSRHYTTLKSFFDVNRDWAWYLPEFCSAVITS